MGKIATDLWDAVERRTVAGMPGRAAASPLGRGEGWTVDDVVCTSGPGDHPFEERHETVSVALVVAGSFQYRSPAGRDLLSPGGILLGNPGDRFECGHQHGTGDRCVAFHYAPEYFERLAAEAGVARDARRFHHPRIPPLREGTRLVAGAVAGLLGSNGPGWEELAIETAVATLRLAAGLPGWGPAPPGDTVARVTAGVRAIEREPGSAWSLARLAREAGRSRFHYLRAFRQVTGVTPHQFVLRARLRAAAARLLHHDLRVIDVALESGFGDVSNFNRAFRAEFGVTPRSYRSRAGAAV